MVLNSVLSFEYCGLDMVKGTYFHGLLLRSVVTWPGLLTEKTPDNDNRITATH